MEAMLRNLDRDSDGRLEEEELQGRSREFVQRIAQRAGVRIDNDGEVRISDLTNALGGGRGGQQPGGQNGGGNQDDEDLPPEIQAMRFGEEGFLAFAEPQAEDDSEEERNPDDANAAASDAAAQAAKAKEAAERAQAEAKALLDKHDANKNGQLDRDEWLKISKNPTSDTNRDGVITLAELVRKSAALNRLVRGEGSYLFSAAADHLPEGLPSWFRNDADGDGQVSMHEFSRTWSESKAREFARYDQNGDGVITPAEAQGG